MVYSILYNTSLGFFSISSLVKVVKYYSNSLGSPLNPVSVLGSSSTLNTELSF
jgi:hypothetical protein